MPTYEYECNRCHVRFERRQSMKDEPLKTCPECGGDVQRMVSGGSGFFGRDWKNLLWGDKPVRAVAVWRLENEFKGF